MSNESGRGHPSLNLGVALLGLELCLNCLNGFIPDLNGVVQVGVFVKEPQHSVVGLGMDALLLEQSDLVVLICE